MKEKEIKYEKAIQELESIVSKMEDGDLDVDSMVENLQRAQKLIKICKDKLTKTDEEIKKLLSDEKK